MRFMARTGRVAALAGLLAGVSPALLAGAAAPVSTRSYRGHEHDADITHFVAVYAHAAGTRLDDCQTCHRGGAFTRAPARQATALNPCDFCHLVSHPREGFAEPLPRTYRETLNPYGLAYREAGRNRGALAAIAGEDSDGDGATNAQEIADLKYPGDPASRPGQRAAPMRVFARTELDSLPAHAQFQLVNSSRHREDFYATFRGVKVRDLLVAAGVDPDDPAIQGLTVIAPDGFLQDVSMEQVEGPFPPGLFYGGLDGLTLGADCGLVQYPALLPEGVVDGAVIPGEPWVLLAWERDGAPLDPAALDVASGRIGGEGHLRLVVPPAPPGAPDRGSPYSPSACADGHDFDAALDHNAGAMVRGVVAIRVNPLPAGVEDFDYRNGGWALVEGGRIAVYGHGVRAPGARAPEEARPR